MKPVPISSNSAQQSLSLSPARYPCPPDLCGPRSLHLAHASPFHRRVSDQPGLVGRARRTSAGSPGIPGHVDRHRGQHRLAEQIWSTRRPPTGRTARPARHGSTLASQRGHPASPNKLRRPLRLAAGTVERILVRPHGSSPITGLGSPRLRRHRSPRPQPRTACLAQPVSSPLQPSHLAGRRPACQSYKARSGGPVRQVPMARSRTR